MTHPIHHIPVCPFSQRRKLYYDYAKGAGNGALLAGRNKSHGLRT